MQINRQSRSRNREKWQKANEQNILIKFFICIFFVKKKNIVTFWPTSSSTHFWRKKATFTKEKISVPS